MTPRQGTEECPAGLRADLLAGAGRLCAVCGNETARDFHRIVAEEGYVDGNVLPLCPNCHQFLFHDERRRRIGGQLPLTVEEARLFLELQARDPRSARERALLAEYSRAPQWPAPLVPLRLHLSRRGDADAATRPGWRDFRARRVYRRQEVRRAVARLRRGRGEPRLLIFQGAPGAGATVAALHAAWLLQRTGGRSAPWGMACLPAHRLTEANVGPAADAVQAAWARLERRGVRFALLIEDVHEAVPLVVELLDRAGGTGELPTTVIATARLTPEPAFDALGGRWGPRVESITLTAAEYDRDAEAIVRRLCSDPAADPAVLARACQPDLTFLSLHADTAGDDREAARRWLARLAARHRPEWRAAVRALGVALAPFSALGLRVCGAALHRTPPGACIRPHVIEALAAAGDIVRHEVEREGRVTTEYALPHLTVAAAVARAAERFDELSFGLDAIPVAADGVTAALWTWFSQHVPDIAPAAAALARDSRRDVTEALHAISRSRAARQSLTQRLLDADDADESARTDRLLLLARLATPSAIPALSAALDSDVTTAALSAQALAATRSPEASAPLAARGLTHPRPAVRAEAARALGIVGDPAASASLVTALEAEQDDEVRGVIADATSRCLDAASEQRLRAILDTGTETCRPAAARALAGARDIASLEALLRALGSPATPLARAALEALESIGGPTVAAGLREALRTANPARRHRIAAALRALGPNGGRVGPLAP